MNTSISAKLNRAVEFKDRQLEERYLESSFEPSRNYLCAQLLIFGAIYFLLSFYDYWYFNDFGRVLPSLIIRFSVFLGCVVTFFLVRKMQNNVSVTTAVSVLEFLFIISYIWLLYNQQAAGYTQQAMAMMLIVFAVFLIPNRWINSLFISFFGIVLFLLVTPLHTPNLQRYDVVQALIYLSITLAISSVSAYRMQFYQRTQYVKETQLKLLSETDRLTKICNRQKFDLAFEEWFQLSRNSSATFSMIMFDLDNFKRINDTYGHQMGDQVLVDCVEAVSDNIRDQDIFARWGGEEFIILLPFNSLLQAKELAERLRLKIESLDFGGKIAVTASFGVVQFRDKEISTALFKRLDKLLYKAKLRGKNIVCWK